MRAAFQADEERAKSPHKSPLQFSLTKVLLFAAVVALSVATFGPLGIGAVVVLLLVTVFFRRGAADRSAFILGTALFFLFLSCVAHGHREAARLSACRNNLRYIGMALQSYHDNYGRFPPQYVTDSDGRPMHSWRVLILPYLPDSDAKAAYEEYRFNEPWNSQHNQKLADEAEHFFRCRTARDLEPGSKFTTHYVAVVGPDTAWPERGKTCLNDFGDGTANTVMLVEIADSDIHWMEPRDLSLEEALSEHDGECRVPASHHFVERTYFFFDTYPLWGHVLMADGSCHCFQSKPSRDEVAALLSIERGDQIDDSHFEWHRQTLLQRIDWTRALSCGLLVIFLVLLVV